MEETILMVTTVQSAVHSGTRILQK